jgi:hypothetical protein
MYPKIPVAITSCCRINLLDQMLESFLNCCLDKDLIPDYYIFDDHSPREYLKKLQKKYKYLKIFHNQKEGQAYSINFMHIQLDRMGVEWYLHLEDDWKFIRQGHFIRDMFDIVNDDNRIKNVTLRYWDCIHIISKKLKYRIHVYKEDEENNNINDWAWYGYTLNPSLQHIPTIKKIGYYEEHILTRNFDKPVAKKYYELGFKRANLEKNYIEHTGLNESKYEKKTVDHLKNFKPNFHLIQLKNAHKGKRCFIIGSGQSLLKLKLSRLKNEITFGSNQIYKFYKHGLNPVKYWHVGDHTCRPKIEMDRRAGFDVDNVGQKFYRAGGFWVHLSYFPNANPYYVEDIQPIKEFKCDLQYPISHGNSITAESIAFAIYMGCNPIYIIGVEMLYQRNESGFTSFDYLKAHQAHEKIKEYCDKHNIQIYNATGMGRLIAYPKIKYNDLFK